MVLLYCHRREKERKWRHGGTNAENKDHKESIGKSCMHAVCVCVCVGSKTTTTTIWHETRAKKKKKRTNNKSTNSSLECYIGPDGGKQSFRILLLLLATSTCNSHWFNKSAPHIKTIHTPALARSLPRWLHWLQFSRLMLSAASAHSVHGGFCWKSSVLFKFVQTHIDA